LASKIVRSPPEGRAEPSESVGLAKAPAAARSARATSASRCETATRGLCSTMRSTSSRVTLCGSCAQAVLAKNRKLSSLIFRLGRAVALGSEHVIHPGQDEERDGEG